MGLQGVSSLGPFSSGVTYVSTTEPTGASNGETWYNPSTGVYYAFYQGNPVPIPPVTVTEETTTFNESGNTVTNSSTSVKNKSVVLEDEEEYGIQNFNTGSTINYDITCNVSNGWVSKLGFYCRDAATYTLTYYVNGSQAYSESFNADSEIVNKFTDHTDWSVLAQAGDTVTVEITGGNVNESVSTSYDGNLFSISSQTINNQENGGQSLRFRSLASDGSATISWGSPNDIESWDLVTYQETEDGGDVTVDVLDGAGNVLFSDVSQNFDISTVSTGNDVQIRANLSRASASEYPTFDYAARRYTR